MEPGEIETATMAMGKRARRREKRRRERWEAIFCDVGFLVWS